MKVLHRIFLPVFFLLLFTFGVFSVLSHFKRDDFEKYYLRLENLSSEQRYQEMNNKNILRSDDIYILNDLQYDKLKFAHDYDEITNLLLSKEYDAFLTSTDELEKFIEENNNFKIVGRNTLKRDYAFLVRADSDIRIRNNNANIIVRYVFWLKQILKGNYGISKDNKHIAQQIQKAFPKTIILLVSTIVVISAFSILVGFLQNSDLNNRLINFFEQIIETVSAFPEFILGFGLIMFFAFRPLEIYYGYHHFFKIPEPISLSRILLGLCYYSLPVLTLSFSGGNISVLVKYVSEQIADIKQKEFYCFFTANGMDRKYLHYMILKEVIPTIVSFVGMKIPLIVGSSVIIEKIFDIKGIGRLAYTYFKDIDIGGILIVFTILYTVSFGLDICVRITNHVMNPVLRRLDHEI